MVLYMNKIHQCNLKGFIHFRFKLVHIGLMLLNQLQVTILVNIMVAYQTMVGNFEQAMEVMKHRK